MVDIKYIYSCIFYEAITHSCSCLTRQIKTRERSPLQTKCKHCSRRCDLGRRNTRQCAEKLHKTPEPRFVIWEKSAWCVLCSVCCVLCAVFCVMYAIMQMQCIIPCEYYFVKSACTLRMRDRIRLERTSCLFHGTTAEFGCHNP